MINLRIRPRFTLMSMLMLMFMLPSAMYAQELSDQLKLESEIEGRLARKIGFILAPELYKLIINAKMEWVTEKVVLEGETTSQSAGTEKDKPTEALPGFQMVEDPQKAGGDKLEKASKSKFKFHKYLRLNNLDVHLILDESVATDKKDYVEMLVRQDLDSAYGAKGHLLVKQFKLIEPQLPWHKAVSRWFYGYLDKRGGSALDLLYLLGVFSMILLLIVWLVARLRRSFRKPTGSSVVPTADPERGVDKSEEDVAIDSILNLLVEAIAQNPLPVRSFMRQLQDSHKKALLAATKTPALTSFFQQLMNFPHPSDAKDVKDKKDLKAKLSMIRTDLDRFLKIQAQQETQPFGYLPLMDDQQIHQVVANEADPIGTMNILCKFLGKGQFTALTCRLTVDEKVKLFKSLKADEPSETEVERVEHLMRARFEKLKGQSSVLATAAEALEREFLENDADVAQLIDRLKAENYPLGPGFEKYQVSFEQLLDLDREILRKVIDKVPNDTLARALGKDPVDGAVKEALGDMRSKLIESMKGRYRGIGNDEVQQAKIEVLRVYWATT